MSKRALADVLWEAANEHLRIGDYPGNLYSCDAVYHCFSVPFLRVVPLNWLGELGCPRSDTGFPDWRDGDELQGIRYMWLLIAMHLAEDEQVEVHFA